MIRLLGCGDGAVAPRFVPQLEALEGRVVLSGKVKIDFEVADPGVPVQVSTVPAPAAGLLAAPADPGGATGATAPVHVHGSGVSGFDRVGGIWVDPAKTDKDKFEPYYA